MHAATFLRSGRRPLALGALAGAFAAALLGFSADPAQAAYSAQVEAGTLTITGDAASDQLVLRLQAGSPSTLEVDVGGDGTADFSFDRNTFTAIDVHAGAGDDTVRIDQSGGAFADEAVTMDGGAGNDTLLGGAGAETLAGGKGDDVVDGGQGSDLALLGGGDDRFHWDPGDGSDVVEGQAGADLLDFFGANVGEKVELSANGSRARFTRDVALVTIDLDGVEQVDYHAFGGADTAIVGDLTGTDVDTAHVDLAFLGGGDLQPDAVVVRGTAGGDRVSIGSTLDGVLVAGLRTHVQVAGAEAAYDTVKVETLGGADAVTTGVGVSGPESIDVDGGDGSDAVRYDGTIAADTIAVVANGLEASTVAPGTARIDTTAVEGLALYGLGDADSISATGNIAPLTSLTLDGGDGNDDLRGGNGADLLLGGKGNDTVDGNQGTDRALLGDGDDRFEWDPGDGSDVVEGQAGSDLLDFFGSAAGERIDVATNGKRVRLTRDIGAVVLDLAGVERLGYHALGGADTILINELSGTDVQAADVDLGLLDGSGDAQPDTVIANGTSRRDTVQVTRTGDQVLTTGLVPQLRIAGSEAADDTLRIQTLDGDDDVTVAPDVAELIRPVVDLGNDG